MYISITGSVYIKTINKRGFIFIYNDTSCVYVSMYAPSMTTTERATRIMNIYLSPGLTWNALCVCVCVCACVCIRRGKNEMEKNKKKNSNERSQRSAESWLWQVRVVSEVKFRRSTGPIVARNGRRRVNNSCEIYRVL